MKYHVGCGADIKPGYINIDGSNRKADVVADMKTFDYQPCQHIESHHSFEHLSYAHSMALLVRWSLALELNGTLLIDVPDVLRIAAEAPKTAQGMAKAMRLIYGSHEAPWAFHISGWTPEWITMALSSFGYSDINITHYGNSDHDFPNYGMSTIAVKKTCFSKDKLLYLGKELLGYYCHPSEVQLHQKFCSDFERMI